MRFDDSWFLVLLLILPLCYMYGGKRSVLVYSTIGVVKSIRPSLKVRLMRLPGVLALVALAFIIVALARPQLVNREREVSTKGTDILLAIDVSGSMSAEDFTPENRLFVAKEVVKGFIRGRTSDRIGLVAFAGEAYTLSPLTVDYGILLTMMDSLEIGRFKDGTAIGMAIAEGARRLKDSEAETKIIILLTDGVNNSGNIDPITAANVAHALGVKIYTIGVGKEGGAPIPVNSPVFGKVYARDRSGNIILTQMDEETLKKVADISEAKYYRATNKDKLVQIYEEIDALEKSDIRVKEYSNTTEIYHYFLIAAVLLFLLSSLLKATWLWSYP